MKLRCFVDYKIENNEEKISKKDLHAIKKDNEITFKDDNDKMKIIIKEENVILEKDNLTSTVTFNFKKNATNEAEYFIKMLNSFMNMKIKTNELEISDNRVYVEYEIWLEDEYSGEFKYEIEIKEM